jgi:hypothetical protein
MKNGDVLKRQQLISALLVLVFAAPAIDAEISRKERKQAAQMFKDRDLYIRFNAPSTKGRHPYGVYYSPLVEVSPQGASAGAEGGTDFGFFHAQGTIFEIRINDPVKLEELDWDEEREEDGLTVEIWTLPNQGVDFGFWGMKSGGGSGGTLRFEDGLLTSSVASGVGLDLDNP